MSFSLTDWIHGKSTDSWKYFGCHIEADAVVFRVWAPGAREVSVAGPFCGWKEGCHIASEIEPGVFECKIQALPEYTPYKFVISCADGRKIFKSDPYAFHTETPPENASKVYYFRPFEWNDAKWMEKRESSEQSLNIYQIHAGSFRTYENGKPLNYRKLGMELVPYMKRLGYTHLGLMSLLEHMKISAPDRNTTGFFAITSRYGVPRDFCRMAELLHQSDLGIIMDVDFLGFPEDDFGLSSFTGSPVWEAETENGKCYFDFEKPEITSFLLSSASFLLENFHLDGLRFHHSGEIAQRPGGLECLRNLVGTLRKNYPGVCLAGDSDAIPFTHITKNTAARTLLQLASGVNIPIPQLHNNIIHQIDLPVLAEKSLIDQMPGSYDEKFARLRAATACYRILPNAKLSFMGNEFAQFTTWNPDKELDWNLLDYEKHRKFLSMICSINDFYRKTPAIRQEDALCERFELLETDSYPGVKGFIRHDKTGNQIFVIANFNDYPISKFVLGVEKRGKYAEIFSTDEVQYGGNGQNCNVNFAKLHPADGKPFCIEAFLPPLTTVYLYKSAGIAAKNCKS